MLVTGPKTFCKEPSSSAGVAPYHEKCSAKELTYLGQEADKLAA